MRADVECGQHVTAAIFCRLFELETFTLARGCSVGFGLAISVMGVLSGTAAATAQSISLDYKLSASGVGAADLHAEIAYNEQTYRVSVTGGTFGAVDLFSSLTIRAAVEGTLERPRISPVAFRSDNVYEGEPRQAGVRWNGAEAIAENVVPSLAEEQRTPIPDDARLDALDPMSALFSFALGGPASGVCVGKVKVFDGRRSYSLTLDAAGGDGAQEGVDIGGVVVSALKCRVTSHRTGGKSPDGVFSSSSDVEAADIWFWRSPSGYALPVRVEADAPIGYAVAQLVRLPGL